MGLDPLLCPPDPLRVDVISGWFLGRYITAHDPSMSYVLNAARTILWPAWYFK